MLLIAWISNSPPVAVLAGGSLLGLGAAFALTMPLGARLRRQRLEFAWWLSPSEQSAIVGTTVPKVPFDIRCYIRNRSEKHLRMSSLSPVIPDDLKLVDPDDQDLLIPAKARTEFHFSFSAAAPGRTVLQGLAVSVPGPGNLFKAPLYFPNPLAIKVLPRASIRPYRAAWTITGLPVERSGLTVLRRHEGGTELRELRDYKPGDPFKAIAFKASARLGKLLVREVEREIQEVNYVILDVSGSMRGGPPGHRKLDLTIEIAAAEARRALYRGDRVGLITVDGRILSHVSPGEGQQQMIPIYNALLAATEVVDQDLTEVEDQQLIPLLGRYIKRQEGIDYAVKEGWRDADIISHVKGVLREEFDKSSLYRVLASDPSYMALRQFCRLRGIPLRYRAETPPRVKGEGLATALKTAIGNTRVPRSLMVISDLDGIYNIEVLSKILSLLKMRAHSIVFVFPDAKSFIDPPSKPLHADLAFVYGMVEDRRVREARSFLGRLGIPLLVSSRRDAPEGIVAKAHSARRLS